MADAKMEALFASMDELNCLLADILTNSSNYEDVSTEYENANGADQQADWDAYATLDQIDRDMNYGKQASEQASRPEPIPERPELTWILVDTEELVQTMLHKLDELRDLPFVVDLEGENLGREGTITLMIIFNEEISTCWLVDVHVLGAKAFDTSIDTENEIDTTDIFPCEKLDAGVRALSVRSFLESRTRIKLFWDVRMDSNALWFLYKVKVAGIHDVQLRVVLALRREYLISLKVAVCKYVKLSPQERTAFEDTKSGMDYTIFSQRPLTERAINYAIGDVRYIMELYHHFYDYLDDMQRWMCLFEDGHRLAVSRSIDYYGSSKAPKWLDYLPAYDSSRRIVKGYRGLTRAVCLATCTAAWGHAHYCSRRCPCYPECRDRLFDYKARSLLRDPPAYPPLETALFKAQDNAVEWSKKQGDYYGVGSPDTDYVGRLTDEWGNLIDWFGRRVDENGCLLDECGHRIDEWGDRIDEERESDPEDWWSSQNGEEGDDQPGEDQPGQDQPGQDPPGQDQPGEESEKAENTEDRNGEESEKEDEDEPESTW